MEDTVDRLRGRKNPTAPKQRKGGVPASVPDHVLDDCQRTFQAAQESNSKTSKNFYDDTALMALVCRHDRVLFIANMKSAGEKQYYALALLEKLFEEVPEDWNAGILYDVGCQLDRSCQKVSL